MNSLQQHRGVLITAVVAVAVGVGCYAIVRSDPFAERGSTLFALDLSSLYEVDASLIQFAQTAEIKAPLNDVRAIASGPADKIYIAGDQAVRVLSAGGDELAAMTTEGRPSCLAVGGSDHVAPGRIYVGAGQRIELFDPDGKPAGVWDVPGEDAILTSIAVADQDVFVADAGSQVVFRFDTTGQVVGKIGGAEGRPFNVPSYYFDIALSPAGLVHVANPGVLRIETYSFDGQMEVRWGEAGSGIDDFFGCCNPTQFAVLPSGEIVTSEKGVPRVKVYSEYGEFGSVVAGPQQLDVAESELGDPRAVQAKAVFDVATDSQGRVLVLDPRRKTVRVFTRVQPASEEAANDPENNEPENNEPENETENDERETVEDKTSDTDAKAAGETEAKGG
ncbi:MAG: NHL repeat-containing protein [Pirellulaceae bacterium]|jgi:hypothetical protein|nr:NHL repeat-containing protein [Pirellulaceae bacterium]MDP7017482.1 NHL repeat-containing protein [Pirellulaceae bacterium]